MEMDGRVVLVTGGTSGLGQAIAEGFAARGAKVALTGRRKALGEQVVSAIRASGGVATFIEGDIAKSEEVRAATDRTVEAYGRLDIAINNAGVGAPGGKLAEIPEAEFDEVLATNLRGVWLSMKYQIQRFLQQGNGGCIINMGSILGHVAWGAAAGYSAAHYVAAKHAVEGLTKTAAADYGRDGIRVNTLAPGVVVTEMSEPLIAAGAPLMKYWESQTALGRFASVQDVVGAAVFLAGAGAGYVTGTTLVVDGGYLAQ